MKLQSIARGLTLAGAVALSTGVLADGMPGSVKDAPPPFSWTGFYIGGNFGAAFVNDGAMNADPADGLTTANLVPCAAQGSCVLNRPGASATGAQFGLQAGYNLQLQNFLVGVEADIQGTTANASRGVFTNVPVVNPVTLGAQQFHGAANASLEWYGTVRARLGLLVTPTLLAYVTGGFAYGEVTRTYGFDYIQFNERVAGRSSTISTGWTAGGGLEWAITNRVMIGAEYLWLNLDDGNRFLAAAVAPGVATCNTTNCNFNVRSSDMETHIGRVKVNFKF